MNSFLPLKRFGQNFLIDKSILNRMADACSLKGDESVLEIGPGQGALTRVILPRVGSLTAVEADARLLERLRQEFQGTTLNLHHADILTFNIASLKESLPIKVVGNIPYNISTPIIEKFMAERAAVKTLFLTVQKEFAERLVALPGTRDYSALTCLINTFAVPQLLFNISSKAFCPMPKVQSCFMRIDFRAALEVPLKNESAFIRLVRQTFLHRRKTILNALLAFALKEKVRAVLSQAGVPENDRPEDLTIGQFAGISNLFEEAS